MIGHVISAFILLVVVGGALQARDYRKWEKRFGHADEQRIFLTEGSIRNTKNRDRMWMRLGAFVALVVLSAAIYCGFMRK